ncbi:MAG: hypothetical protein R3348_01645 [Xanthomonadales bacterium]|nr:hypothetical protein [Xanthomonadales bacterium]
MSFFDELKRRNVFKVGVAYAVGGWLLLQLTEVLSELLSLPSTIGPIVVAIVAIGFPIAIFFAWAFELTPEGVKREKDVDRTQSITSQTGKKLNHAIIVMLTLAVAYLLFDKFALRDAQTGPQTASLAAQPARSLESSESTPTAADIAEPAIDPRSIAVLPFQNRSRNEDDAFFVEGVHDDLLTNLARIGDLKVISRTSVLRFKDTEKPIPEIAAELGVATVMEGAVQRAGGTVRINVQLIDAQTDEHLWAEIFDREMTAENLFAIQSEISQQIAEALKSTLSPEEQERISDRPTDNLAAYNAYLRGRQLQGRRNSADLQSALEEFERAVELDPEFALAWVGVADTNMLLVSYSNLPFLDALETREAAVARALKLNDQLGEAQLSRAMVLDDREQYEEADAAFQRALELSPNYARAYQWYGDFVTRWPARWPESMKLTRKAAELDPLSSIIQMELAEKLNMLGRFNAAEAQLYRLMQSDPDFAPLASMMSAVKFNLGKFDEQITWMQKTLDADPGRVGLYENMAFAQLNLANPEALERIRERIRNIDDSHRSLGWIDLVEAVYRKNYPAALEAGRWYGEQIGNPPSFGGFFGFVHMLSGDYDRALADFLRAEPRFADRASWQDAIQQQTAQGCLIGWLMIRTGDGDKGMALVDQTLRYLEVELPQYTEHSDRFGPDACYMARGEPEKSLAAFETRVDHGHIGGWWFQTQLPWNEPLRGTPRFEAALAQIEATVAAQRERLAQGEVATGP